MIGQANRQVGGETHAKGFVVEHRAITLDYARLFEFLNPSQAGGG
jgi:hypothetical protein